MENATAVVIEKVAQKFEADGLPRIAGRLLGRLLLSAEARSLDQLADDLQVSKASVSTNARLLEWRGVLERVTRAGDRRDYYAIAEDLHRRMLARMLESIQQTHDLLEVALLAPPAEDPTVSERLETFASFFGDMRDVIKAAASRWQLRNHTDGSARRVAGSLR